MSEETVGSAPVETPAVATPTAPAPAQATPSATTQTPATGGQGPEGWVPSYRLRESREAAIRESRAQFEQAQIQWQQERAQMQRQLQALTGMQAPANPEVEQVKQQFGQLYTGLPQLDERAEDILALLDQAQAIQEQQVHYWNNYGRQQVDRLFSGIEKATGAPLTDEGRRIAHQAFVGFVGSSPEFTERYGNDPTLVDDYVKVFTSSFIQPANRQAAAQIQTRTAGLALPQDRPGSAAPPVAAPPKPKDADERAQNAWALYQQSAKS